MVAFSRSLLLMILVTLMMVNADQILDEEKESLEYEQELFKKQQKEEDYKIQAKLEEQRPQIKFPETFVIGLTTNDYALNLTELIYYDMKRGKIRIQLQYSLMGLEPSKVFDIVLDQKKEMIAVQTDVDCKFSHFGKSLMPVSMFFTMFNSLTHYKGEEDGLHKFVLMNFDEENKISPRMHFYFDNTGEFKKSRIEQQDMGVFDFEAIIPFRERIFTDMDWIMGPCDEIEEQILEESNSFVSFTKQLIITLLGSEEDILTIIGYNPKNMKTPLEQSKNNVDDDEEDFNDD